MTDTNTAGTDVSTTRPAAPTPAEQPQASPATRAAMKGVVDVITEAALSPEAQKIAGTTRVMNSVYGYLQNVCGRKLDELTPTDVLKLGSILKTIGEFDIESSHRFRR